MKGLTLLIISISLLIVGCKKKNPEYEAVDLKIDGYTTGANVAFQGGFGQDEEAAITLGPIDNTFKVKQVSFLFGGTGSPDTRDIVLKIYEDNGNTSAGPLLYSSNYNLTASDTELQTIDLSGQDIEIENGGSIRVAIQMTATGTPSVATDDDGTIDDSRNWVRHSSGWDPSSKFLITGDWVIRASIDKEK